MNKGKTMVEVACTIDDRDSLMVECSDNEQFDFEIYRGNVCLGSVSLDLENAIKIRDLLIENTKQI
ncbi:hypothetical protein AAXB25_14930 [Paenibacillus lautus]|uniref:hypothetical protein n=1 Tax=Paenibacillus lautus TaxID=1401 RepID=UPI003D277BA2